MISLLHCQIRYILNLKWNMILLIVFIYRNLNIFHNLEHDTYDYILLSCNFEIFSHHLQRNKKNSIKYLFSSIFILNKDWREKRKFTDKAFVKLSRQLLQFLNSGLFSLYPMIYPSRILSNDLLWNHLYSRGSIFVDYKIIFLFART